MRFLLSGLSQGWSCLLAGDLDQIRERALAGDALEGMHDVGGRHSCGDRVPAVGPVVAEDDEAGMAF